MSLAMEVEKLEGRLRRTQEVAAEVFLTLKLNLESGAIVGSTLQGTGQLLQLVAGWEKLLKREGVL